MGPVSWSWWYWLLSKGIFIEVSEEFLISQANAQQVG